MIIIFSLVGGLAIAIILQLLLASLGLALGLTVLDLSPAKTDADTETTSSKSAQSKFSLPTAGLLGNLLGLGIALGLSGIIFITAFLAADFSLIINPRQGVIFGLIFWATYWLLLTWLGTTTVAGIVDSLLGGAIASIKQVFSAFKPSPSTPDSESSEQSMLQSLAAELSQVANTQQALPALLASQREALVAEISDHTHLSPDQTATILTDLSPTKPETPSTTYSPATTSSSLISKIESTLDLPSWQQISQQVLKQVDFSEVEGLVYQQLPSFLQSEDEQNENGRSSSEQRQQSQQTQPLEQTVTAKAIQRKLISYCRYTNVDLLTPDNLTSKIDNQKEEHSVDTLSNIQIDIGAIDKVLSKRQNLATEKKQELVEVLELAWQSEQPPENPPEQSLPTQPKQSPKRPPEHNTEESYPQKVQHALESSVQSVQWQEILAPSVHEAQTLTETLKTQIVRYLQKQDKAAFHPVQMAKDLTHIVGSGLRSLPHPSDLPDLSELESLWDKTSWQQALEERKDLTVEEIQEILAWSEAAWKPAAKQMGTWVHTLQSQAEQLGDLLDSTSLDTARQKIVEQVGIAKEKFDEQAIALKTELQMQADAARKQAAITLWWIFSALLFSGIAAGSAGWLATIY